MDKASDEFRDCRSVALLPLNIQKQPDFEVTAFQHPIREGLEDVLTLINRISGHEDGFFHFIE